MLEVSEFDASIRSNFGNVDGGVEAVFAARSPLIFEATDIVYRPRLEGFAGIFRIERAVPRLIGDDRHDDTVAQLGLDVVPARHESVGPAYSRGSSHQELAVGQQGKFPAETADA